MPDYGDGNTRLPGVPSHRDQSIVLDNGPTLFGALAIKLSANLTQTEHNPNAIRPGRLSIAPDDDRAAWGYTTATHQAGINTAEEANEICNEANRTAIEDFMVPAPSQARSKPTWPWNGGPSTRFAAVLKHRD